MAELAHAALGLAVGLVMALTGAGGGILAVPLLVLVLGLGVASAVPIALLAVFVGAAAGALLGLRAGSVRYKAALLMAGAGMLLAPLGVWLSHRLDDRLLAGLLAAILFYVARAGYRRARASPAAEPALWEAPPPCIQDSNSGRFVWTGRCAARIAAAGSLAGFLSGLLGVGGGFVIVPALQRHTRLAAQAVIATSLAVTALIALAGLGATAIAGHLAAGAALPFAAGSLAGMLGGRRLAARLAARTLQLAFAALAGAVAIGMLASALLRG